MEKQILAYIVICGLLSTTGCASYEKILVNDSGQRYRCKTEGYGLIGSSRASSMYEDCVNNAKEKGYK